MRLAYTSTLTTFLLISLAALKVHAAPDPNASLFAPAIESAAIDPSASYTYQVATQKRVPVNPEEFLLVLGFGKPERPLAWGAGQTEQAKTEHVFQYVITFRQPVSIGSLFLAGTPQTLAVLKPGVTEAPDAANDAQWQEVPILTGQPSLRVIPFPVGFQTRAIRLTDRLLKGWSQVNAVRFLKSRLVNVTPWAQAYAESEYTSISNGGAPSFTYAAKLITAGTGPWQNTGPNNYGRVERTPISDVDPAWFILSWKESHAISALWLSSNIAGMELDYFDGPADLNPRAATEREWHRIRQPQRSGEFGGERWQFAPVQTRGLRLRVIKLTPLSHAAVLAINMLHVYADLNDQPVPTPKVVVEDHPPLAIPYHLDQDGIVTLVVNDAEGRRVRNLIARAPRKQGDQVEYWDLRDEFGLAMPNGTYQFKGITHPGLTLRYQMTPYPNVVDNSPTNAPWLTSMSGPDGWMADHTAPRAAVATGDHVYFGSPVSESGVSLIECDLTGQKLWAYPSFAGFTGVYWLGADETTVYVAAPAWNTAAAWGVDPATEAIWAVDIKTKNVRELARLSPTAQRKRGLQAMVARGGKLYLSVRAPNDWLAGAAASSDVDIEKCYPLYKVQRKERHAYEVVANPRNDFMRLFRLTGDAPGGGSETGGDVIYLESTRGNTPRQHIVLAFKKPVALGSAVYPVPRDPKVKVQLSILKPSAPYPPNPGRAGDWIPFATNGTAPWDVAMAPSNTVTRALRVTFNRGEDDIFGQEDESGLFGAEKALDANLDTGIETKADNEIAHDYWQGQLEGLRLLSRRYENVAATAKVRVSSGTVGADGVWDAQRTEPLSEAAPAVYALEWAAPQKVRGIAIKEVDGKRTKIDVYTGAGAGPIDINAREGWEEVGTYVQSRRSHWSGTPGYNGKARYLDGCVDFGKEISTRAVRLRVVEQWADNLPVASGVRDDQGGMELDAKRCRIYGVAVLRYVGGEAPTDPSMFQRVDVVDTANGKIVNELPLAEPGPIAFNPAGDLIAVSSTNLVKLNLQGGQPQTLASDLIQPQAMACDSQGNIYVYDHAPDRRVIRVYDPSGKHARDIGEPGGYQVGPWNPNRLHDITAIAIDKQDQLWAVDTTYYPKRISLWDAAKGTFKKDFFGNTAYGGGGVLDPWDKNRLFYGPMEFALDWETGRTRMKNLTWLGEPRAGEQPVKIGDRMYLVTRITEANSTQPCGIVYLYEKDHIKMVAAVGGAAGFPPLLQPALQAGLGFKVMNQHSVIWTDRNGDGAVQADEVTLTPMAKGMGALTGFNRDLGVQAGQFRYQVKEFLANSTPVYEMKSIPGLVIGGPYRLDNGSFFSQSGTDVKPREAGVAADGKPIWSYPTLGSGVQAIANAQHWSHDQVVCEFGIVGHETVPTGDLGEFVVLHTNLGGWNIWTADGLLAGRIFRDQRDPQAKTWTMKEHERGLALSDITVGQEHFFGYLTRTFADNKFYAVAGHNHASVIEISGLEQFKRFGGNLNVGLAEQVKTQEWEKHHEKDAVYARSPVIDCYRLKTPPMIDGQLNDWPARINAGLANGAWFRIAYDDRMLYVCYNVSGLGPLKNTGEQWDRLFKTGAAVDLQIATDPQAPADRKAPVAGDKRLLMTFQNEKPIAVLYNAVVPGTPADKVWQAISPVAKISFDQVTQLQSVRLAIKSSDKGYVVEAAIPLAELGLKLQPDLRLKMDWGVLITDSAGNALLRREYWANHATGVVADVPSEARLNPDLWGYILFHDTGEKIPDHLATPDLDKPVSSDKLLKEFEKDLDEDLK